MRLPPFIARSCFARLCLVLIAAAFLSSCKEETPEAPLLTIAAISPDTGSKNTSVTLAGTGFSTDPAANTVTLNDKPCVVTAASATSLTFTIPAKAGSGPIMVKSNGRTAQSPPFTYILTVTVSTFAGGERGDADGTGTAAQFANPLGLAFDKDGNLFVVDGDNHSIRRITPAGVVSTFAGGTLGSADGTGTAAQFYHPLGLAFDKDGNLFVADGENHRIRRITPAGVVSTFAGGEIGDADGTGTAAGFGSPQSLAFDRDGNLFVADYLSARIRKITPAGVVTTFAGGEIGDADGTGTAAQFVGPQGLAFDKDGNLFVADGNNHRIRRITPAGVVTTFAGSTRGFADGTGTAAEFRSPYGLTSDRDGNLFVADGNNNRIRRITPAGVVTTFAGSTRGFADGTGTAAEFRLPTDLAFDKDGNLFVADANNRIRKIVSE